MPSYPQSACELRSMLQLSSKNLQLGAKGVTFQKDRGYFWAMVFFPRYYVASTSWSISNKCGMKFVLGFLLCSLNLKRLSTTPFHSRHFLLPPSELLIHYMLATALSCSFVAITFSCSLIICFFLFAH